tara:strand:- start:873 stop:1421 length:549 start_codon:yes stop_codon:yes gene_type:complete
MTFLVEWRKRVGVARAREITNQAASVGTSMHNFLESHIISKDREYVPSPTHSKAKKMADIIINKELINVSEVWGSEVKLYYEDLYAGTTDLVGIYKDEPYIIDFKQTNKPKKEEWVKDYYLQLAAYAHAHNHVTGSNIKNGIILMCSQDLELQTFELTGDKFDDYSAQWFDRVEQYNELLIG